MRREWIDKVSAEKFELGDAKMMQGMGRNERKGSKGRLLVG
jgi:hypothetical protein